MRRDALVERFAPVLDRLDEFGDPLSSSDELARLAYGSPFHFHQQLRAFTGLARHEALGEIWWLLRELAPAT